MSRVQTNPDKIRQAKLANINETSKVYGVTHQSRDDNYVYLNQSIRNTDLTTESVTANFSSNRSTPIIVDSNSYLVAIERFKIPSNLIPIMQFFDNKYEIVMTYDGTTIREFIQWVPTTSPQISKQQIFHFQHMVTMINDLLISVLAQLAVLKPAMPTTNAPFITFDSSTNLFELYFEDDWILADTAKLGFNQPLWGLFMFESKAILLADQNVDYYELVAQNNINNYLVVSSIPPFPYVGNFYISTQPFKTINAWSPISRIIITTTMPVRQELIAGQDNVTESILTDFLPSHNSTVDNLEYIFNANGNHRWHDIKSNQPLTRTDLKIFWEGYDGARNPIQISFNREASIKLVFKQRGQIVT